MKNIFIFFLLLIAANLSAQISQTEKTEFQEMLNLEKKKGLSFLDNNINPNTSNYDLKYHRIELDVDPNIYFITGKVTSKFITNQNMTSIYFDFTNQLTVSEVQYHGQNIAFQQLPNEIKIDFSIPIPNATLDSLSISYSGAPPTTNQAFNKYTSGGNPVIYTLSEPYGARDWWPCKQSLNDKIEKLDIKITCPAAYSAASNGKLISESILPNGKKLTYWQTNYPIPAYLFAIGVTNYDKTTTQIGPANNSFPFLNWVYPSTTNNATSQANINWTNSAMILFEEHFGPYPYRNEKYGHMQFGFSGGMEHATMSSMGGWGKTLIAHELAHQWFGDKITCKTWNDIWINEGFATYGEFIVLEKLLYTPAQMKTYFQSNINNICSSPSGSLYVPDALLNNINTIFSYRLSYLKGGHTLRMLRWILGETAYTNAIKNYSANTNLAYNYASTTDFKNSLLASTGIDFTEFFNDWVYGQGYPSYTIRWNQNPTTNLGLNLNISQTQSHSSVSYYEMPLPIRVTGTAGQVLDLVVQNNQNNQQTFHTVPFTIASVEFDPDVFIISKNNQVIKDVTMSIDEFKQPEIKMYPNPAKESVKISGLLKNTEYELYNMEGRLIDKNIYYLNKNISVQKLEKGTYFLKINNQNFKLIKE